jgi:hypothetical protein
MYGGQRELPAEPTELPEPARASDRDDREQALLDDRLQPMALAFEPLNRQQDHLRLSQGWPSLVRAS